MRERFIGGGRAGGCLLLVVLALTLASVVPARAGSSSTCTFEDGKVTVIFHNDGSSGTLQLDDTGTIILYKDEDSPTAQPCGTGATTLTTDRIVVEDRSDNQRSDATRDGSTGIILDLRNGHFADGGDEIPIDIDLGPGPLDVFGVIAGGEHDHFTFGVQKGNLQKDTRAEIEFARLPDFGFATLQSGNDRACSSGGRGTGRASLIGWVFIGGADDDRMCGGLVTDRLLGGRGDDVLRGKRGGDTLKGRDGQDTLRGGVSSDALYGNKGNDGLYGGGSSDFCSGGPGADQKGRCERQ
ncbi:MAG: hypothetical protein M3198_01085 [Actinomycetota bacterium]|nr:hypothetical protein [Actinomycetota bacterium]